MKSTSKMYAAELMQKIQNPPEWAAAVKPLRNKAHGALANINDVTAHLAGLHKHYAELLEQIEQQEKKGEEHQRDVHDLQVLYQVGWSASISEPVQIEIFKRCEHPGMPNSMGVCRGFRALIQPELESGMMPHLQVPRDMPTLQAAIEVVPSGGTIWVASGVYHERILLNRNVHVVGLDNPVVARGCVVTGGNAKLTGLTFQASGSEKTLVLADTQAVLQECVVDGGGGVEGGEPVQERERVDTLCVERGRRRGNLRGERRGRRRADVS